MSAERCRCSIAAVPVGQHLSPLAQARLSKAAAQWVAEASPVEAKWAEVSRAEVLDPGLPVAAPRRWTGPISMMTCRSEEQAWSFEF